MSCIQLCYFPTFQLWGEWEGMLLSGSHLNTLEPDAGLIIDETILDSSAEENTLIYFPFFSKGGGGGGGGSATMEF